MIGAKKRTQGSSMLRFQGSIDLAKLVPVANDRVSLEPESGWSWVSLPGIELRWDTSFVDVSISDDAIALVARQARQVPNRALKAAQWIERYARCAEHAADDVEGAFAAAIVDLYKRRVLLFVDRFSIETLCYRASNGSLGFANRACDVPRIDSVVRAQSIYDYLYFHVIPAPQTIFDSVRRVEAAHYVIVSEDDTHTSRYWTPSFVEDDVRDLSGRLRQFTRLVEDSVKEEAHSQSTACFLSGGTDSSCVAGMLTRLFGVPAHAYSIGFEEHGYDEMAYARIAARHFGLVHHEYYLTPDDLVRGIPRVAASFDQPFGNSSVLPSYYCAARAKEDGFDRMLAGDGGDELFAGNSRYAMQKVLQTYQMLPTALRTAILEPAAKNWTLFRRTPGLRWIGGYIRHASVRLPDRFDTFKLLPNLGEQSLLEPDFLAMVHPERPLAQQRETWQAINARSLINRMLTYDWKYTLADNDLPKVRHATQLAGISVGYPFLSRALTDFSLLLPPRWKLKGLKLRWFFKEALRGFLPQEILRKKKHGFGLPFGHWMLRHARLRELAHDSLEAIGRRGIVRPQFTMELLTVRVPEAPGYYGEMVWLLVMLEQWLRTHEVRWASDMGFGRSAKGAIEPTTDSRTSSN
jgi:asparagine synthase (glutamine-hydrolysing)